MNWQRRQEWRCLMSLLPSMETSLAPADLGVSPVPLNCSALATGGPGQPVFAQAVLSVGLHTSLFPNNPLLSPSIVLQAWSTYQLLACDSLVLACDKIGGLVSQPKPTESLSKLFSSVLSFS